MKILAYIGMLLLQLLVPWKVIAGAVGLWKRILKKEVKT